ncbi:MAG: hypothetical protein GWN31_04770 [Candidatus Thorarchaeota archaeon]|nr:hypothetical protein [Candidatus Thorarchaeota archaeon]NIW51371.1 hypothetical protein [Candidatus Korarchaeota archaeon]
MEKVMFLQMILETRSKSPWMDMNELRLNASTDYDLFESKLRHIISGGKTLALIHSYDEKGSWLLLHPDLYEPFNGESFWEELESHGKFLKEELQMTLKEDTKVKLLRIAGYPLVSKLTTVHDGQHFENFVLLGIVQEATREYDRVYSTYSFLKRKCAFSGVTGSFFIVISNEVLKSYFLLKVNQLTRIADFLEDLLVERLNYISLVVFHDPRRDIARMLIGEPPKFYRGGRIEGNNHSKKVTGTIKKILQDDPSPLIYEIG